MASSTSNSDITAHERFVGIEKAEELLKGIIIPPRPAVLVGVLEEQARPDPDLTKIGDLIASDVALAASTLKVVNSPFFGLRRKVGSVHHAVSLLGVSNIVHIVTGLMLHTAFRDEKNPFMNEYWTKTNRIALVSALVARTYTDVRLRKRIPRAFFWIAASRSCYGASRTIRTFTGMLPARLRDR